MKTNHLPAGPLAALVVAVLLSASTAGAEPVSPISSLLAGGPEFFLHGLGTSTRLFPGETEAGPSETSSAEGKLTKAVGGGLGLSFPMASPKWDAYVGIGFFGIGFMTKKLLPEKSFPFPAVFGVDAEFIYFPAESGISDIHLAFHGLFGVDVLHSMDHLTFFPYVGVGLGFEIISGSKTMPWGEKKADETSVFFPAEFGAGIAYNLSAGMKLFARLGFSFPLNAANVSAFLRFGGGILFEI